MRTAGHKGQHRDAASAEREREYGRRRYAENPERSNEYSRRWYAENIERKREYSRRWREETVERRRENFRRWYAENAERRREWQRRWLEENAEWVRERRRQYRTENAEQHRGHERTRRARKRGAPGFGIPPGFEEVLNQAQAGLCAYCGVNPVKQLDHIVPLVNGGADCVCNVIGACKSCNPSKYDRDVHEWYRERFGGHFEYPLWMTAPIGAHNHATRLAEDAAA